LTATPVALETADDIALADKLKGARERIIGELSKHIVGQQGVIEQVLLSLFVGGNSLIIGVPGLAKTLLIATIAKALDLKFSRIQFTPDLMPSDITGTDLVQEDPATGQRRMVFVPGPIFGNIVLADEINRTPPKTQSALLEAMQEHRVTVQGRTYTLEEPFFVFATQNPIDGTPLRPLERAVTGQDIIAFQALVRRVPVAEPVLRYAVNLVRTTRPSTGNGTPEFVSKWVSYGASVRAAQYLILGAKARAIVQGRYHVSFEDVRALAHPVLRHRILKNFHAESERVSSDTLVDRLLETVPTPKSVM
jgi:MoxR-like ATPase